MSDRDKIPEPWAQMAAYWDFKIPRYRAIFWGYRWVVWFRTPWKIRYRKGPVDYYQFGWIVLTIG
jgi:hypothetical protein